MKDKDTKIQFFFSVLNQFDDRRLLAYSMLPVYPFGNYLLTFIYSNHTIYLGGKCNANMETADNFAFNFNFLVVVNQQRPLNQGKVSQREHTSMIC